MFKKQEGITLVALVITIIVLLILAGVSISLVVGNNGVLTQASSAVVTNNVASIKEKVTNSLAAVETKYFTLWASNTAVTRTSVYGGATGGLQTELLNQLGTGYTVTISGELVGTTTRTITITKSGVETMVFTLTDGINAENGVYKLSSSVTYSSVGKSGTTTVNV